MFLNHDVGDLAGGDDKALRLQVGAESSPPARATQSSSVSTKACNSLPKDCPRRASGKEGFIPLARTFGRRHVSIDRAKMASVLEEEVLHHDSPIAPVFDICRQAAAIQ